MAERSESTTRIARVGPRFRVAAAAFAVGLVALGLAACQPVKKGPVTLVSTNPPLFPGFTTGVADYVNRCDPNTPTDVQVNAPDGTAVSVNGSPPASGQYGVQVAQSVGARFTIVVTTDGNSTTHYVRCLPGDFPNWSVEKSGSTAAQFYATAMVQGFGPPGYSVVFDNNGVPIWWLAPHPTFLLQPLPNKHFAVMNLGGGMQEYDLSGKLVRSLNAVGGPTDFHDVIQLPNGHYVMATAQNVPCNLSSWGLGIAETCIDHVFQEIDPAAPTVPVWTWDTALHIPVTETADAWINEQTSQSRAAYDPYHYNSIEYTGDGFILSFRHLNAVYKVDHTVAGSIQWKLGGKPRNDGTSLTIVNDSLGGPDSQHDARLLPDGKTLSIFDNGTNGLGPARAPRNVRYELDTQAKTATLVGQLFDSDDPAAGCCGSARPLPGGNIVMGWGGRNHISEYAPDGSRIFRIIGAFVYRGTPIPPGVFTHDEFRNGMDALALAASSAHGAEAPANSGNSPLGTTIASMQCCLK